MPTKIPVSTPRGRNYESAPWIYLLWGLPFILVAVTSAAFAASLVSLTVAGALWTFSVAWFGVGCLINARSCGRVHCVIDGIAFPLLAALGALNVLSVVSLDWNFFWGAFILILAASFVPEFVWKKYS